MSVCIICAVGAVLVTVLAKSIAFVLGPSKTVAVDRSPFLFICNNHTLFFVTIYLDVWMMGPLLGLCYTGRCCCAARVSWRALFCWFLFFHCLLDNQPDAVSAKKWLTVRVTECLRRSPSRSALYKSPISFLKKKSVHWTSAWKFYKEWKKCLHHRDSIWSVFFRASVLCWVNEEPTPIICCNWRHSLWYLLLVDLGEGLAELPLIPVVSGSGWRTSKQLLCFHPFDTAVCVFVDRLLDGWRAVVHKIATFVEGELSHESETMY